MPTAMSVLREGYRRMVRIRLFEERLALLHKSGELYGGAHTSVGQEAAVVGALLAVNSDDYMTGTHRSHGHPIGKGAAIEPLMAELYGRATGVCRGNGGSMHLADFSVGSLGESGIVASAMPVAVGAALTAKATQSGRVCVCFFGDGAANEGAFHESLNLAAIWKLPVIFLCENNGYAITTAQADSMLIENVAERAAGYGMPGAIVDGQDFLAVYEATAAAAARARAGDGPSLVEAKTYRYAEHALSLNLRYRTQEEIDRWKARDPIPFLGARLVTSGAASEAALRQIFDEETARLDEAVERARAAPEPRPEQAFDHVFRNPIPVYFDDQIITTRAGE